VCKSFGVFDNVMLSEDEYERFQRMYEWDYEQRIDELSIYLAQSGKEYKSHYATLLSFARMRYGRRSSSFNMGNACEAEEIPTHGVAAAPFDFGHSPPLRMTFPPPYQPKTLQDCSSTASESLKYADFDPEEELQKAIRRSGFFDDEDLG
ncbi:MAG: hypothetical protein IJY01_00840, partial [Clostridia bacterium]|nr:hypothetical protein [Clostridia bacterium]